MKQIILLSFYFLAQFALFAQDQESIYTISGKIIDNETRKTLEFVSVRVGESNIATVSNTEGNFVLKVPANEQVSSITFSHVGYESLELPLAYFNNNKNIVRLKPIFLSLQEVEIRKGDATAYMKEVFSKIPANYPEQANQMVGFYREAMKKNNHYVAVTEAVVDIYKASYSKLDWDQAQLYKARRSSAPEQIDTIFVKYKGGVSTALDLDLAKNYPNIFYDDFELFYNFSFEGKIYDNKRAQYIISFEQKDGINLPLFRGRFYIDIATQAISKIEFGTNLETQQDATPLFIRKRPPGVKIKVTDASYIVQYYEEDGKWFFEYSRASLAFNCRWEKRLFSSTYSILSELAITDRAEEGVSKFTRKNRLKTTDVIAEKASDFEDKNYWEDYNIIEPEKDIENAIKKLSRKLKRRESNE